jgi:hypothetical protein
LIAINYDEKNEIISFCFVYFLICKIEEREVSSLTLAIMFTSSSFYLLLPLMVTIMIGLTYFITDRIFCLCYGMQLRGSQLKENAKKIIDLRTKHRGIKTIR